MSSFKLADIYKTKNTFDNYYDLFFRGRVDLICKITHIDVTKSQMCWSSWKKMYFFPNFFSPPSQVCFDHERKISIRKRRRGCWYVGCRILFLLPFQVILSSPFLFNHPGFKLSSPILIGHIRQDDFWRTLSKHTSRFHSTTLLRLGAGICKPFQIKINLHFEKKVPSRDEEKVVSLSKVIIDGIDWLLGDFFAPDSLTLYSRTPLDGS